MFFSGNNSESGDSDDQNSTVTISPPRKTRRVIDHDHAYITSPRTSHRKLITCKQKLKEKTDLLKLQGCTIIRLKRTVASLKDMIDRLKEDGRVSRDCLNCLESIHGDGVKELWQRAIRNGDTDTISRGQYPSALCSFALTLHFYSPRAYRFVREKMNLALPSESGIAQALPIFTVIVNKPFSVQKCLEIYWVSLLLLIEDISLTSKFLFYDFELYVDELYNNIILYFQFFLTQIHKMINHCFMKKI